MRLRALLIVSVAACGGASSTTVARPSQGATENRWASASFVQRHETMTFAVLPVLARRFQQHRRTQSAELTCVSCHGPNAVEVAYRMPNSLLPTLDPSDMPQNAEAQWMAEVVTPTVDRLMRAGGTTTCFSCHPSAGGGGS